MTLQFFDICHLLVLASSFPTAPSSSYVKKHWSRAYERILVCEKVAREARHQGVDIALAVAVAAKETRFTYKTSPKGAQGPMGVLPKYHCPNKTAKGCDLIKAGVSALDKFLRHSQGNTCQALAHYNAGYNGRCEEGRPEYDFYALEVLEYYDTACAKAPDLCASC